MSKFISRLSSLERLDSYIALVNTPGAANLKRLATRLDGLVEYSMAQSDAKMEYDYLFKQLTDNAKPGTSTADITSDPRLKIGRAHV